MAEIQQVRVYQLKKAIADIEIVTNDTTIGELIEILQDGKDKKCPQCSDTGTIDADRNGEKDTVCPTCNGDGRTATQYTIDYDNSILVFKPAE